MNKYVCKKCGYSGDFDFLPDTFICPVCNSDRTFFDVFDEDVSDLEIDAVIDSLIDEAMDITTSKIVNNIEEDKRVRISNYNNCILFIKRRKRMPYKQ